MVLRGFLKFLGGLLVALLILGVILAGVGYFAVREFDPNMFRAEFEKYLTQQTGFRVELGDIKLRWRIRPQLRVAGLKIFHPQTHEKILQSDQVRIDADLTLIGLKHFSMSQVVIQGPEIFLKRNRDGIWNCQVAKEPAVPVSASVSSSSKESHISIDEPSKRTQSVLRRNLDYITQGWTFGIGKILVRDATIRFMDQTVEPAYGLEIARAEAEVRQSSSPGAFRFTAGGSVFGAAKRNLELEGALDLALRSLDLQLRYGPEQAVFKGRVNWTNILPHFEGTLEIRDLDLESVIPEVYKQGEYLSGRLNAKAQLSFDGTDPAMIKQSLGGLGTVEIRNGALRNRNLLEEVFSRLSPVMAITTALGGELPPELKEMLKGRDTPFESLKVAYEIQVEIVKVNEFRLMHPSYQLSGKGSCGISDKRVDSSMHLLLSQSISGYLMRKIQEMEMMADRNGQVVIPFRYSGVLPNAVVQPDLSFISAQLLQRGTDVLLNRGLGQLSKYLERKRKK